jgi:hypothetical protein
MPLRQTLLVGFAAAVLCPAQVPELAGTVIDSNGIPAQGVELVLTPVNAGRPGELQQSLGNYSEEGGVFEFYGVPAGMYQLIAKKTGFLDSLYGATNADSSGAPISVREGQPLKGLQVVLTPQSVISGRVATSDGSSAGMITVLLLRMGYRNGHPALVPAGNARTTRSGDFRIAKLRAGSYYLIGEGQPRGYGLAPRPEADQPTYFPGSNRFSEAERIEVATGAFVEGLYLPMRRSASFTVRGTVRGAGQQVKGINVSLRPDSTVLGAIFNGGTTTTNDSGEFEIASVLPGPASLYAYRRGDTPLAGRAELTVNSDVSGIVIDLQPPFDIRGTVVLEEGLSVPQFYVSLVRSNGEIASGTPVHEGQVHFGGVLADQYRLGFGDIPSGAYVKSAHFGGAEALDAPFELSTDSSTKELRIEIGRTSGQVVGFVQDADGAPQQAILSLIPDPPRPLQGWRYFVTDALSNGAFRFIGVPPGRYLLQAWESLEQDAQFNAEFTQSHAAAGVSIEMAEGVTIQANTAKIVVQP